jgi:hypothetical protein
VKKWVTSHRNNRTWVVAYGWDNFLWLQTYEEVGTAKCEAVVKSFKKCDISNALDGTKMMQYLKEINVWTITTVMLSVLVNSNIEDFKPTETFYSTAILLGVCEFQLQTHHGQHYNGMRTYKNKLLCHFDTRDRK